MMKLASSERFVTSLNLSPHPHTFDITFTEIQLWVYYVNTFPFQLFYNFVEFIVTDMNKSNSILPSIELIFIVSVYHYFYCHFYKFFTFRTTFIRSQLHQHGATTFSVSFYHYFYCYFSGCLSHCFSKFFGFCNVVEFHPVLGAHWEIFLFQH